MDVKLVMAKGRPREHAIQLRSAETVIGRHHDCNLRIPSNEVSRRHCVLRFQKGLLTAEDLKSTNGTLVNGKPITGVYTVYPGDELEVGPVTFTVEYELPIQEAPAEELEVVAVEEDDDVIVIDETADVLNFQAEPTLPNPPAAAKAEKKEEKSEEEGAIPVDFDLDAQPLQLPDDGNLRDILSRLDH
jgi:pSer/pThr/pTyr-binding forkhead associated (FHA) protein